MGGNAFDRIAATIDPPMVIVTTRAGDEMDGCLVGFSTQCSIDPLRYLVGLSVTNRTYELAMRASTLVVHVLHDAVGPPLASLFGEEDRGDTDKFARATGRPDPTVCP